MTNARELLEGTTPGPWLYETDDEGSSMGWIVDNPGQTLFKVAGDSAQQACNAELAAAAPDLARQVIQLEAQLAERDARIQSDAVTIERMREALRRIELLSTNHGGWFEIDPWKWGQMMGDEARAILTGSGCER